MLKLSCKNFSEETIKKVTWVQRMYSQWRIYCNAQQSDALIMCDLDDTETITEDNLVYGMSHFITEVRKINGEQFPAKTFLL